VKYRTIGTDPKTRREVSVLSLGAMRFGTTTDEATSFAVLDRYVEAGGTFIDTSGNYAFWVNGTQGGESEELLGRWRRSRGTSRIRRCRWPRPCMPSPRWWPRAPWACWG
jgi:aryl-alcohol dehydrogenase-like predicted oxidoreductase